MSEFEPSVFSIVAIDGKWGVAAGGRVLALTTCRRDAKALVDAATRVLKDKPGHHSRVPPEPRSFED